MAIDTSIYGNLLAAPRSALQYQQDYAAQDDARAARQLNALQLQDTRAKLADAELGRQDQAAYRNLLAQNAGKPQAELIPVLEQAGTPLAMTRAQELRKAASEEAHRVAQTAQANAAAGHSQAQAADLATKARIAEHDRAVNEVLSMQSPQDAMRSLQQHAPKMAPEEVRQYSQSLMGISTPEQWQQWQDGMALRLMDAKSREEIKLKRQEFQQRKQADASTFANRDLIEDPSRPGQFVPNTPLINAKKQIAQAGAQVTMGTPLPVTLPDGTQGYVQPANRPGAAPTVLRIPPGAGGAGGNVTPPPPKPEHTKPIPDSAIRTITENRNSLSKIDAAIQAAEDPANAGSLGWKNALPGAEAVRSYTDAGGVPIRSLVADIGSLKIHDRTGAAMSLGEAVRLKPFIPSAGDPSDVVVSKLRQLRVEYSNILDDMKEAYSPANGYRENSVLNAPAPVVPVPRPGGKPAAAAGKTTDLGGGFVLKH
jgi:hypothetical protein